MHTDETTSMTTRLSRALKGGAAIALAVAFTAWAPIAQGAGTAQSSDGTWSCNYNSFNFDATTNNLTISCATVVANQPGTFSLNASASTVAPNGTGVTVNVVRSGGNTGAYSVAYNATVTGLTGAMLNSTAISGTFSGNVSFASGQGTQSFTFLPGSTNGSLTLTLVNPVPATDGTSGPTTASTTPLTITVAPVGTCTTTATYNSAFTTNGQKILFELKPGETAAVAYTPVAGQTIWKVSTSDTVNTPPTADHEVTISQCPGDFTPVYPCEYQAQYTGATMTTQASPTAPIYACKLTLGTKYYMNVRQVVKGNTAQTSCTLTSCEIRTQVQISP